MRNATILVVRLRGTATETIKNIVLAGIGKLILIDGGDVGEEDLGAGFFFRDEDVGKKASTFLLNLPMYREFNGEFSHHSIQRVDVAKARIESLNPLVTVETIPTFKVLDNQELESTIKGVDLVCVTDWDRDDLVSC